MIADKIYSDSSQVYSNFSMQFIFSHRGFCRKIKSILTLPAAFHVRFCCTASGCHP